MQRSFAVSESQFANPTYVRIASRQTQPALKLILDPRRLVRWAYIGRLCLAVAIFIAAITSWSDIAADRTLVASLVFALSMVMTVASAAYSEIYRKPLTPAFLYTQAVFDLAVVTAVVHVTNGAGSPFSALYILVIATSSLLVPTSGGLLVTAVGLVFYLIEVVLFSGRRVPRRERGSRSRPCGSRSRSSVSSHSSFVI